MERVGDLIKEVTAEILREMKDPAIGDALVSLTDVKVSNDLGVARIGVSVLPADEHRDHVMAALDRASGFIRRELNARIRLRKIPELRFEMDDSLERGARILDLLRQTGTEPGTEDA